MPVSANTWMSKEQMMLTCRRGTGCMVGLLWQVEDLLTRVRWGNGILTLSGRHRVILFTVIIGIKEFLKPLDEIKIVLKSAFDQFLHRNYLNQGRGGRENQHVKTDSFLQAFYSAEHKIRKHTLSTFILLKDACNSLKL